jgi:hypothetical protein
MPQLDDLQRMLIEDELMRGIYWCKDRSGFITEHVAGAYDGHRGHIQCIAVAAADPQTTPVSPSPSAASSSEAS